MKHVGTIIEFENGVKVELTEYDGIEGPSSGVAVTIPTYSGGQRFEITAVRDEAGDYAVFIPWSKEFGGEPMLMENGTEVCGGVLHLGGPEQDDDPDDRPCKNCGGEHGPRRRGTIYCERCHTG